MAHALDHLKNSCQIPEERKLVVVWSDRIPYLYEMHLQQYVFYCSICDDLVDTRLESLNDHSKLRNHGENCITKKFGEFIFQPGPGHIKLNMVKCLHFCWPILCP